MGKFSIEVRMETLVCYECGIMYAAPLQWAMDKMKDDDEWIHCPNGHKNRYDWGDEKDQPKEDIAALKRQMEELRRRNFQLMHEREQAEARASHAAGGACQDAQTETRGESEPGHMAGEAAGFEIRAGADGKWKCPVCEKSCGGKPSLTMHLRSQHFMERLPNGRWAPKPVPPMPEGGYEIMDSQSNGGQPRLACPICERRYVDREALWDHLRFRHDLECWNGRWIPKADFADRVARMTGGGER